MLFAFYQQALAMTNHLSLWCNKPDRLGQFHYYCNCHYQKYTRYHCYVYMPSDFHWFRQWRHQYHQLTSEWFNTNDATLFPKDSRTTLSQDLLGHPGWSPTGMKAVQHRISRRLLQCPSEIHLSFRCALLRGFSVSRQEVGRPFRAAVAQRRLTPCHNSGWCNQAGSYQSPTSQQWLVGTRSSKL